MPSGSPGGAGAAPGAGVSVVVPTRDRPQSLARLLAALSRQTRPPDEVLVMDASDAPPDALALAARFPALPLLVHIPSRPGVCAQRNAGIRRASGRFVLLCDDDIEPPPDYIERLEGYLAADGSRGAVSGLLVEPDARGAFRPGFETPSLRHLLFAFTFQLTVWGDVEATRARGPLRPLLAWLRRWYRRRGNTWSAAGWPLVTQVRGPVVRTATYGLGAALVRRDWLLAAPYDEALGPHGIGDNYGVALAFPGERPIAVLTDLPVRHHRVPANRLPEARSHGLRVLALDHFMRTTGRSSGRFDRRNTAALAWSLLGNAIRFALRLRLRMLGVTLKTLAVVVAGRNPLGRGAPPPGPAAGMAGRVGTGS